MVEDNFRETNLADDAMDKETPDSRKPARPLTAKERLRHIFEAEPMMNVIDKELFDTRTEKVFEILGEALARSYGPYGAPAVISEYPYYHITKDGYTIQKNIAFDKTTSYIDQIIAGMAGDICGRLNYSVGDGTTTAIVATNQIYQAYRRLKPVMDKHHFLPRDVMKVFNEVKDDLINEILNRAIPIRSLPKDELAKFIHDIVYVSSNGNDEITQIITELYQELGYPAINVEQSPDGITRKKIVTGFQLDAILTDKLYINSDDSTMKIKNADVLVFDHRITRDEYIYILDVMKKECAQRGRHLICLAPYYDESMIASLAAPDLNTEFAKTKDIKLVLLRYSNTSAHHKKMITALTMLFNTVMITREMSDKMIEDIKAFADAKDKTSVYPVNLDDRNIPGIYYVGTGGDFKILEHEDDKADTYFVNLKDKFRVGFVSEASMGLKNSVFNGFYENKNLHNAFINEAKEELEAAEKKYQRLGTFNVEITQCQERLNALQLQLGVIEVGGDSEYSKGYLKDAVDDAVKASRSAYNFGVVHGCNQTLLTALRSMIDKKSETESEIWKCVVSIIFNGFCGVYKTILTNMNIEEIVRPVDRNLSDAVIEQSLYDAFHRDSMDDLLSTGYYKELIKSLTPEERDRIWNRLGDVYDLADFIIRLAIVRDTPFDVTTGKLSEHIIHSAETDVQILRATCDLINLLITGNQLVISQYGRFNS